MKVSTLGGGGKGGWLDLVWFGVGDKLEDGLMSW